MSEEPPEDEPDRSDETPADPARTDDLPAERTRSTEGGWLSNLVSALERLEEVYWTDRRETDHSVVDYSVATRVGLEDLPTKRALERRREEITERRGSDRSSPANRTRTHRVRRRAEPIVTARGYEDELLVTTDLAGVDPDQITVGFDGPELVIGVEGRELERVRSPWRSQDAEAAIHNGILTVRVVPIRS